MYIDKKLWEKLKENIDNLYWDEDRMSSDGRYFLKQIDNKALFYDLCKHRKWHKIQNGNRAGKAQGGLLPIIAY